VPSPRLDAAAFRARFRQRFADPAFAPLAAEIDRPAAAAWQALLLHRGAALGPGGSRSPGDLDSLDLSRALTG